MTTNRRYSESEIALILEHAGAAQEKAQDATSNALSTTSGEGLTLEQLQDIGTEVGIAPEFVARAASAVARGDLVPTQQRTWLGLPVGVSRTIEFGRTVSDEEWDRIVVTLRETFEARGRLQRDGSFRQWSNGNLQALLEPSANGHRLRLMTRKGDVAVRVLLGGVALATAFSIWELMILRGGGIGAGGVLVPSLLALFGIGSWAAIGFQLPRWARTRAAQMESIASHTIDATRALPEGS